MRLDITALQRAIQCQMVMQVRTRLGALADHHCRYHYHAAESRPKCLPERLALQPHSEAGEENPDGLPAHHVRNSHCWVVGSLCRAAVGRGGDLSRPSHHTNPPDACFYRMMSGYDARFPDDPLGRDMLLSRLHWGLILVGGSLGCEVR
jgi:hypothetical protein